MNYGHARTAYTRAVRRAHNVARPEGTPRLMFRQMHDALFNRHRLPSRPWVVRAWDWIADRLVSGRGEWRWVHTN